MPQVQIIYFGKQAMVDEDQLDLLFRKESLVKKGVALQKIHPNVDPTIAQIELDAVMKEIRKLNRKIRKTVNFL